MAQPISRVAVVGGGIAGTMCSLVLKNRGLTPVIIDQAVGRDGTSTGGLGGRLRGVGAQFLRATDPRLQSVMGMLQNAHLIQPWRARFGMLGSQGGGFLPATIVTSGMGNARGGVLGLTPAEPLVETTNTMDQDRGAATDAGDFCQFVQGSTTPTFVGVPTMLNLCPQIANLADISTVGNTKVLGASMAVEGGWILDLEENNSNRIQQHFDALILATHDPSLASTIVQSIVDAEVKVGGYSSLEDAIEKNSGDSTTNTFPLVLKRLSALASHLQQVRDEGRSPLFTVQATYPRGFSDSIPFDAVSVPGSPYLQFLAREGSKPGKSEIDSDVWTAVSTSQLATHVLAMKDLSGKEQEEHIQRVITGEMANLWSYYFNSDPTMVPNPTTIHVKRWGAALCSKGLELQEDSITLSSWRLGICGDFIRQSSAYPTPWEAAALSGLEAGERMSSFLAQPES